VAATESVRGQTWFTRHGKAALLVLVVAGIAVGFFGPSKAGDYGGPVQSGWSLSPDGNVVEPVWCQSNPFVCNVQRPSVADIQAGQQAVAVWTTIGVLGWLLAAASAVVLFFLWLNGRSRTGSSAYRRCPLCRERVRSDAVVCKHCGRNIEPA